MHKENDIVLITLALFGKRERELITKENGVCVCHMIHMKQDDAGSRIVSKKKYEKKTSRGNGRVEESPVGGTFIRVVCGN